MVTKNYNISKNVIRQIGIGVNKSICFTFKNINILGKCQKICIKHFLIFNKILLLFILVWIFQYSNEEFTCKGSRSTKQDEEKASLRFYRLLAQSYLFNSRLDGSYNYSNAENERMFMRNYMNDGLFKSQAYNESEKRDNLRNNIYNEQNDFAKEGYSREYDSKFNSAEFGTSRKKNGGRNPFNYQSNNENNKPASFMNEDIYNKNYYNERENIDELNKKLHDDWSKFLNEDYSNEFESNNFNSPHYDTYKSQYDTYKSKYDTYKSPYDTYKSQYDIYKSQYDDRNKYSYPSREANYVPPFMDENINRLNNNYRDGFDDTKKNNINDDKGMNFVRDEFYDEYNNNMNTSPEYLFSQEWDNENTHDGFSSGWNNYNSENSDHKDQIKVETPYIRVVEEIDDESNNKRDNYDMLNKDSSCNRNEKMEYYFQSDKFPVDCKGMYTNSNIVVEEYDTPVDLKETNNNFYSFNEKLNNERPKKYMPEDKEFINEIGHMSSTWSNSSSSHSSSSHSSSSHFASSHSSSSHFSSSHSPPSHSSSSHSPPSHSPPSHSPPSHSPSSHFPSPHSQPSFIPETFQESNVESPEFQLPTFESAPVHISEYELPNFDLLEYDLPHFDPSEFRPEIFDESEFKTEIFDESEFRPEIFDESEFRPEIFDESEFKPSVFDPSEYKNSTFKESKFSTSSHSTRSYENEFNLSSDRRNSESSSRIHVDDENYKRLKDILSNLCSSREKIYDLSKEEKEFLVKMLKLDYEDFNFNSRGNTRNYNDSSPFTNFELKRIHLKIKAFIYKCLLRLLQSYEKTTENHVGSNIYDIY
ncbi:Plasmodium exported protein (hyp1), unknown function [Plasmodium reichenowi]|uniref:Exported protein (Hyp1) n=1 Tax=Plasmodium reichenowi TaxID=5854 RepID=A0A060RSK4_PLARE|nr:Plasmodium exported protein (hyp1), unknown function [Plasmodium reichenowi]